MSLLLQGTPCQRSCETHTHTHTHPCREESSPCLTHWSHGTSTMVSIVQWHSYGFRREIPQIDFNLRINLGATVFLGTGECACSANQPPMGAPPGPAQSQTSRFVIPVVNKHDLTYCYHKSWMSKNTLELLSIVALKNFWRSECIDKVRNTIRYLFCLFAFERMRTGVFDCRSG